MKIELGSHYLAFVLDEACRERILKEFPPKHEVVKCHHVTIAYEITKDNLLFLQTLVNKDPQVCIQTTVYIEADGIDLFAVCVHGMMMRFDYKHYHLTHSLREGRESSNSNLVFDRKIQQHHWKCGVIVPLSGKFELIPYKEKVNQS